MRWLVHAVEFAVGAVQIQLDASARGIVVMNTPFGNSITTAEHAIAMLFALARDIPEASQSTHEGKWEKSRFMGVELYGKTLGIIGCGNIGSIVADRALGLKMKVAAYDPFLSLERAADIGVDKLDLDELFKRADFISLHTPMTDATRGIIDAVAIEKMKDGVYIINCVPARPSDPADSTPAPIPDPGCCGTRFSFVVERNLDTLRSSS